MIKSQKIAKFMILLMILLMFSTSVNAEDQQGVEIEIGNITFMYSNGNTSTYQGDLGLIGMYFVNKLDNETYFMHESMTRGMAMVSHKTFKFNEKFIVDCIDQKDLGGRTYRYHISNLTYENGTPVRKLDISDSHLTAEERKYFDDYAQQRQDYHSQQEEYALENLEDSYSESSSHKSSGYMVGTGGVGYYRSF